MTTRLAGGAPLDDEHGRPMDITTVHEDDLLLDRLGRGEEPADGDAIAATLWRWRAALPSEDPADPVDDELLAAALAALHPPPVSRLARRSAILSAVLTLGTVAASAEQAGPHSPLWPLTQLMYRDRAEVRAAVDAAEDSVSAARISIDGGRYDQASRLLDDATASVERIGEGAGTDRLREEIAALRTLIPADTEEATADPTGRVPSPDPTPSVVPRSVVPPLPADSLPPTSDPSTVGPTVVPSVPPVGPGVIEVPPSVVLGRSAPADGETPVVDGPIGLVR